MSTHIIVAIDKYGGFGKDGKIPWHFPEDFKHFQETTKDHVCVMGRRTYEDMHDMILYRQNKGKRGKRKKKHIKGDVLKGRTSYVVSNSDIEIHGATKVPELNSVYTKHRGEKIFVLGGERMFIEALSRIDSVICTIIDDDYKCDRFFPVDILHRKFKIASGKKVQTKKGPELMIVEYVRK